MSWFLGVGSGPCLFQSTYLVLGLKIDVSAPCPQRGVLEGTLLLYSPSHLPRRRGAANSFTHSLVFIGTISLVGAIDTTLKPEPALKFPLDSPQWGVEGTLLFLPAPPFLPPSAADSSPPDFCPSPV